METILKQPPIELKENGEPKIVQLDDEEIKIIESQYKKKLKIQYTRDGQTKLKASHYAGYFVLPKRVIEVSPKYAKANFLGMIKYALELPEIGTDKLPINENDTFWEILVSIFLKKLEELFQRGLMSNYIEYEENLNLIRGKIDFKEHLLRNYNRKDRIYCRFDEFSQNYTPAKTRGVGEKLKNIFCMPSDPLAQGSLRFERRHLVSKLGANFCWV